MKKKIKITPMIVLTIRTILILWARQTIQHLHFVLRANKIRYRTFICKLLYLQSRKFWWNKRQKVCRLMAVNSNDDLIRMSSEVAMFVGAFLYLLAAVREAGFLGLQMFIENLVSI